MMKGLLVIGSTSLETAPKESPFHVLDILKYFR